MEVTEKDINALVEDTPLQEKVSKMKGKCRVFAEHLEVYARQGSFPIPHLFFFSFFFSLSLSLPIFLSPPLQPSSNIKTKSLNSTNGAQNKPKSKRKLPMSRVAISQPSQRCLLPHLSQKQRGMMTRMCLFELFLQLFLLVRLGLLLLRILSPLLLLLLLPPPPRPLLLLLHNLPKLPLLLLPRMI